MDLSAFNVPEDGDYGSLAIRDFDPRNPVHNLYAMLKMQGDLNEGVEAYNWYSGRLFAVIGDDTPIMPLLDMEGFSVSKGIHEAGGKVRKLHRECGFYKDMRTGAFLDEWHNPLINETVAVKPIYNDPVNAVWAPIIEARLGPKKELVRIPMLLDWQFMGDTGICAMDVNTAWDNILDPKIWVRESTGPRVRVSEYTQFFVNMSEVLDPATSWCRYNGAWQRIGAYLPWMFMGGKQGFLFYRFVTRRLANIDELPAHLRARTEERLPLYLHAPDEWAEPNVTSYEVYARDNSPAPVS